MLADFDTQRIRDDCLCFAAATLPL